MSLRFIPCCVLLTGLALLASGCSPTADAANQTAALEAQEGEFCGGIAGIPCAEGFTCVDDPNDTCDPNQGGADCGGICQQEEKKKSCTGREPGYNYVSRDPAECPAILFTCPEGQSAFFNDCGCGCTTSACNYNDPNRTYVSQDPEQCAAIRFTCPEGQSAFFDDCGCGCTTAP